MSLTIEKYVKSCNDKLNGEVEAIIEQLNGEINWEFIKSKIMFGKFKGKNYILLDEDYIKWLINHSKDNRLTVENKETLRKYVIYEALHEMMFERHEYEWEEDNLNAWEDQQDI
jgi:hypothetical protein